MGGERSGDVWVFFKWFCFCFLLSLFFFFFFEIFSPHENLCFISDGNEGKVEYHLYIAT